VNFDEYMFLLACANFSFIAGFMISVSKKNYLLLIPTSIGAGLIFGAAYCQSNELIVPLYKMAPALAGIYYAVIAILNLRGIRRRPDRRNMAMMILFTAIGHFAATGACFYLWSE
jgi:hypothetical protein